MYIPEMATVRQIFPTGRVDSVRDELIAGIRDRAHLSGIGKGARIAVTTGSRSIRNIPLIIGTVVEELRRTGAEPFIVPAMGSHGGGTESGHLHILESLGVTERSVHAPIVPCTETVFIGTTATGVPVHIGRTALEADGVVVVNRVKPHTAFHGDIESGLCKMVAVGLGLRDGAEAMHRGGLGTAIVESFRLAREKIRSVCGIAVIENAREETAGIRVASPGEFEAADRELLERCRTMMPRLPVREFDILIVDEMGKNISGSGMDTNIIGFWRRYGGDRDPDYSTLIVLNLTPESGGNAMGIGLADLTTQKLVNAIDMKRTNANAMTSQWALGRIPITLENDRACIEAALGRYAPPETARIIRIKNTLALENLQVSKNLLPSCDDREDIEMIAPPRPMLFDSDGFLA